MISEVTRDNIKTSLVQAVQKCAREGFDLSQKDCPVISGDLKRSGNYSDITDGAEIKYTADYAPLVEHGCAESRVMVSNSYSKKGFYTRPYVRKQAARKPTFFIKNSLEKVFGTLADKATLEFITRFKNVSH
jgi:hypothetical protein